VESINKNNTKIIIKILKKYLKNNKNTKKILKK